MNENRVTINELATKMVDELRRIGYSEETIWRNYHPKIRMVVNYYERAGIEKAMANGEPTESLEENYTVKDEEMIKKLYGLK